MKVSLHIGAHKTATTFIQSALERNADALLRQGTAVLPSEELRVEVTRPLKPRPDDGESDARVARARQCLDAYLGRSDIQRLILSDENLLGEPAKIVADASLYADTQARLAALAPLLAGHEVTVFFAVRNLAEFTRSIYCEALWWMTGPFISAEQHKAAWADGAHSWVPVVQAICEAFPAANVVVWPHVLSRMHPLIPLEAVAGVEGFNWQLDQVYKRHSMGAAAVQKLIEIGATEGTDAMRAAADRIKRENPRAALERPYVLWSEEEAKTLARAFNRDMRQLRNFGTPVSVLAPPVDA